MQDAHILTLTAGILGVIFFTLSIWVVVCRQKARVLLGDGAGSDEPGRKSLHIAIRAHGNFAEYVPFTLLLLAGLAWQHVDAGFLGVLGGALVLGRVLHPFGMRIPRPNAPRALGVTLSWAVLLAASLALIAGAL